MLTKAHKWLVHIMGGVTNAEYEEFRVSCRNFAEAHMEGLKTGDKLEGGHIYGDVPVIGDRAWVRHSEITGCVHVAPWCKGVCIDGVQFIGPTETEDEAGEAGWKYAH